MQRFSSPMDDSSHGSRPQDIGINPSLDSNNYNHSQSLPSENTDLRRSSSFYSRLRQAGGLNSIDNFARSWQRAADFPEVFPRKHSLPGSEDEWATISSEDAGSQGSPQPGPVSNITRSLLDPDVEREGVSFKKGVPSAGIHGTGSFMDRGLGTSYGTISSRASDETQRHAPQLHREQSTHVDGGDRENARDQLLIKQVQREDGIRQNVIVGQSTVPQTIFNSVNVLIGVGLLSLPLAMKQAGWLLGILFLFFAAVATSYTAKILAKCLDADQSLVTYADLAYISFGHRTRLVTSFLFCLELIGACVALVVLFADSLHALLPGLGTLQWKIICGLMLLPLNFLPLRLLSVTSILGIISCTAIVIMICIDGLIKPDAPGSLRQAAKTTLLPDNWATVPLSLGLIMSPWGGHGVFPNIYRDMRRPHKYGESLWATYIFTFLLDCAMAVVGWVMFGDAILDEVTANILLTNKYPRALSICIIVFIAIIPLTKVPLACRPLVATVEVLCGLGPLSHVSINDRRGLRGIIRQSSTAIIRILIVAAIALIAIVFPSFDRIMALMGSALCFTVCIILPLAFYLKIFGNEISPSERVVDWLLLILSSILAIVGTIWAFLPQERIAAR